MQPVTTVIPARSQRQAMDWSLVLLSQGIQAIIEAPAEDHGWQLVIQPPDYDQATAALQAYLRENSRRPWHQALPGTGLIFDWHGLIWFILLALIFFLGQERSTKLTELGVMDSDAVLRGEWWRPFTAVTLHADLPHLLSNVTSGFLLLGLAMGFFGSGHALLAAFLSGAAANVVTLLIYARPHQGLGASGMVMGALGLLTAQSLSLLRTGIDARHLITRGFLAGLLLLVLHGFNPQTDVLAHVAGFVFGLGFGAILAFLPEPLLQKESGNRLTELICAALVAVSWGYPLFFRVSPL